jgi:hypothetical protein
MVIRGLRIVNAGVGIEGQAESHRDSVAYQPGGGGDARGGQEVERSALVVRTPPAPGAEVSEQGVELLSADVLGVDH